MEDDRVAILEAQLAQAKLIAEEADKKYEEVRRALVCSALKHKYLSFSHFACWGRWWWQSVFCSPVSPGNMFPV